MTIDEATRRVSIAMSGFIVGYDGEAEDLAQFAEARDMAIAALRVRQDEASGVLKTIYETPENCRYCSEHLSLEWGYCHECGKPTPWNQRKMRNE